MTALLLKLIAVLTMLIDHIGLVYGIRFFRVIGRLALPIFAFLIANGYRYTHSKWKYALRLFLFALISEIPFDLLLSGDVRYFRRSNILPFPLPSFDNVYFTLVLGLLFLILRGFWQKKYPKAEWFLSLCTFGALGFTAQIFGTDYGIVGVALVAVFGVFDRKEHPVLLCGTAALALAWRQLSGMFTKSLLTAGIPCTRIPFWLAIFGDGAVGFMTRIELVAVLSLIPIFLYNEKSGMPENQTAKKIIQYGFYAFYPLHLFVLILLCIFA